MLSGSSHVPRVTRGFRTGIVIGMAVAILGLVVGTATGTTTPFQQVVVVNGPASPVPVAQQGAVSIANLPANQSVTVSNFPATQPVSGSVSVDNLPGAVLAKKTLNEHVTLDADGFKEFFFNVNVTNIFVRNHDEDSIVIHVGLNTANDSVAIYEGDGDVNQSFAVPIPAHRFSIFCANLVLDCDVDLVVLGT
jgi:hypothetical protein